MTEPNRIWTAALIVIGDEILSGRTQDKNIAQVASWLGVQGIRLREVRVVPDVMEAIIEAVNTLRARNDYLFTTGGIGPTHDDITVDAIAAALGVGVEVHPKARAVLESYYTTRGGLTEARLRMARVPAGADLIIMTAKDAVKFAGLADARCWYLAVRASCEPALIEWLEESLRGSSSH